MSDSTRQLIASWSDDEVISHFIEISSQTDDLEQMECQLKENVRTSLESEGCEPIKIVLTLNALTKKLEGFRQELLSLSREMYVQSFTIEEIRQLLQLRLEYPDLFHKQNQVAMSMSQRLGPVLMRFVFDFLQSAQTIEKAEMPWATSETQC